MNRDLYLGVFAGEEEVLAATRASRALGYRIHDVFTPYAVHGLDEAMGLKPSRLTYVCLAFAVSGLILALFAQYWIGAIDWPVNVGGKPFNSLPAYLPVMFEMTVLLGGLGVLFTLFVWLRIYPGKRAQIMHPGVTDDCFVLALEAPDASFDAESVRELWQNFNVVETRRLEVAS